MNPEFRTPKLIGLAAVVNSDSLHALALRSVLGHSVLGLSDFLGYLGLWVVRH